MTEMKRKREMEKHSKEIGRNREITKMIRKRETLKEIEK
jgi:hypothetical protein